MGITLLLGYCVKEEAVHTVPLIVPSYSPVKGLTITTFNFDFSSSVFEQPDHNKLFFRWDWDNDGNWDTPFSNHTQFEHRYLIAGKKTSRVMAMDLKGLSDTAEFQIDVAQGYSKPKPHLVIKPLRGTPYTDFVFDASGTKDDEDSIGTLKFRWDFDGDRQFETAFSSSYIIHYQFPTIGFYEPTVEVRDTMGLADKISGSVVVTLLDPSIVANFVWTPKLPVTNDTVVFDAGSSHDSLYPDRPMKYRWDWHNDGIYDTEFSDDPLTVHSFMGEGKHAVRLEVRNYRGLINNILIEVPVGHRNQPPVASFKLSSIGGNTKTRIRFDLWGCRDPENAPSELFYRWDWNGDGIWDTNFSGVMEVYHVFSEPGIYRVRLNVMDPGGLTDTISKIISIGRGTNETDILLDKRGASGYEYYGIVKIGGQWWFARNLEYQQVNGQSAQYYDIDYGRLYSYLPLESICPVGWRVPTRDDWDMLLAQFNESTLYDDLAPGGISGFNIVLAGMLDNLVNPPSYTGKDLYGHYWSQTKLAGPSAQSHWIVTFDGKNHQVLPGFNSSLGLYSVRCVK